MYTWTVFFACVIFLGYLPQTLFYFASNIGIIVDRSTICDYFLFSNVLRLTDETRKHF